MKPICRNYVCMVIFFFYRELKIACSEMFKKLRLQAILHVETAINAMREKTTVHVTCQLTLVENSPRTPKESHL